MTTVRWEVDGPVAIVTIDRPAVRNAVDRPTAEALAVAFRRFDADDEALVDGLVRPGHPSTPGYNDPAYALTGRPV
jgi:enoyl-CoA hydratase